MTEERSKWVDKIQKLMAKAEGTTSEEERATFMAKAEELMVQWAIEDHELAAAGTKPRSKPIKLQIKVCEAGVDLWDQLSDMAYHCARLFDCQAVFHGLSARGKYPISMSVVGFQDNVESAEFMYNSLYIQLMAEMLPKYDWALSFMDNMVKFKEAGLTWKGMYDIMHRAGVERCADPEPKRAVFVNYTKIYADYCQSNGIVQVKANPKNYTRNFAAAFSAKIGSRVYEIKQARKQHEDQTTSSGASVALVLADRADEVAAAFKEFFPKVGKGVARQNMTHNAGARMAGSAAGARANMGGSNTLAGRKQLT